jgi:hypothetical protein
MYVLQVAKLFTDGCVGGKHAIHGTRDGHAPANSLEVMMSVLIRVTRSQYIYTSHCSQYSLPLPNSS